MADIDDTGDVFPSVYQLATTDPGIGGPPNDTTGDGTLNRPLRHLAQRTRWLKTRVDALIAAGTQMASTAVAGLVQLSDSVTSNATDRAATANAVRVAHENANGRVPAGRVVAGGGLVTGGGSLNTDRTLTVAAASAADGIEGTRADVAMTPASTKATLDSRLAGVAVLGVGQTWVNVSGSRAGGVNYQNTTGKPIMVAITGSGSGHLEMSSNGTSWIIVGYPSGSDTETGYVIVPPNHFYRITGVFSGIWAELR